MNKPNLSESNDSKQHPTLGMIAIVYAAVASVLLGSLFVATARHELVPIARVIGFGCYGIAIFGAILHVAVGIGLWRNARWLATLVRGTTTAIVVPLLLAVVLSLMLPFRATLDHGSWSIVAAVIAVPWPLFLKYKIQRRA